MLFAGLGGFAQPGMGTQERAFTDSLMLQDKSFRYMSTLDSLLRRINHETDSLQRAQTIEGATKDSGFKLIGNWANNIVLRIVFWTAIGIFIIFVHYKLFGFNLFSSRSTNKNHDTSSDGEELKMAEWYLQQIEKAELVDDYQLATRYRFMHALAGFNDRGLIQYLPEKTNAVYAAEIQDEMLKERFIRLAEIYEYVWYGVHKITRMQYASVKNFFTQTMELI